MAFKFSVVMTAYNSENYLSVAIESIINQSLDFKRNIQIIIIDDASSDHTPDIAYYYQKKYPKNIFVLRNDANYGPSYSRNRGLGHVQGEFVNFLDSDDFITEYAFSKALSLFKKHDEIEQLAAIANGFCFPRGRIKFIRPDGTAADQPTFGQVVTYVGYRNEKFFDVFKDFGSCMELRCTRSAMERKKN